MDKLKPHEIVDNLIKENTWNDLVKDIDINELSYLIHIHPTKLDLSDEKIISETSYSHNEASSTRLIKIEYGCTYITVCCYDECPVDVVRAIPVHDKHRVSDPIRVIIDDD